MEPNISVLIPTLNAGSVLEDCLKSVRSQNYPQEKIEIIVADGGSSDATIEIANKYNCKVVENPLKTGEAGKKAALDHATGEFCALIDSDNILPDSEWMSQMIQPLLHHTDVVGSEPWQYTWRKEDGFITRYCALIGMNDPLCHFLGNYDRLNLISGKWTEIEHKEEDKGDYLVVEFGKSGLPTIGANGTVFRTSFLKQNTQSDYLFDIDILSTYIQKNQSVKFIKVKNGIIHTFCESDIGKFARKQRRRVKDFLFHKTKGDRTYVWDTKSNTAGLLKFVLSCVMIVPLIFHSVKGYMKKPDVAWFFHVLACEITLFEYGLGFISSKFVTSEADRSEWKQ